VRLITGTAVGVGTTMTLMPAGETVETEGAATAVGIDHPGRAPTPVSGGVPQDTPQWRSPAVSTPVAHVVGERKDVAPESPT
jgi:hypothetical protein